MLRQADIEDLLVVSLEKVGAKIRRANANSTLLPQTPPQDEGERLHLPGGLTWSLGRSCRRESSAVVGENRHPTAGEMRGGVGLSLGHPSGSKNHTAFGYTDLTHTRGKGGSGRTFARGVLPSARSDALRP